MLRKQTRFALENEATSLRRRLKGAERAFATNLKTVAQLKLRLDSIQSELERRVREEEERCREYIGINDLERTYFNGARQGSVP